MSAIGYNGRAFTVLLDDLVIAGIGSKTFTMTKEAVDVTTDDSDGWRVLLPNPGVRSVDASIEGVATTENYAIIMAEWSGNVHSDITLQNGDGSTMTAEYGFFLGNLEFSGEKDGHIAFTASIQSSGPVTITPAVSS